MATGSSEASLRNGEASVDGSEMSIGPRADTIGRRESPGGSCEISIVRDEMVVVNGCGGTNHR